MDMSKRVGYGQRRIKITPELIEAMLVNPAEQVSVDLPSDARFVRMWPADVGWHYVMVFESSEWEELDEGEEIPLITPGVKDHGGSET